MSVPSPSKRFKQPIFIQNRYIAQLIAIIFGFVFLGSAVFVGFLAYQQIFLFPRWKPVTATLTSYDLTGGRRAHPSVSYRYEYEGRVYEGSSGIDERTSIFLSQLQFDRRQETVSIRVNPENPAQSGVRRSFVAYLVWTLFIGPFSLLIIWKSKDVMTAEDAKKYYKSKGWM